MLVVRKLDEARTSLLLSRQFQGVTFDLSASEASGEKRAIAFLNIFQRGLRSDFSANGERAKFGSVAATLPWSAVGSADSGVFSGDEYRLWKTHVVITYNLLLESSFIVINLWGGDLSLRVTATYYYCIHM